MAMFSGEVRTYHDVRMMVVSAYGPLDEQSELIFLLALGNALDQMWADLREGPLYLTEWIIPKTEGDVFLLPAGIARICSARGAYEQPEDEDADPIPDLQYQLHAASCSATQGFCADRNEVTWGCTPGALVRAQVGATQIVPEDEPETIVVVGYRKPGAPFFEETGTEDAPCRDWFDIDLPPIFRNVYAKAVVGMVFFMTDDAPRGADWLNLAQSEFTQMKRANPGMVTGTARERGMYQMGTKKYLAPQSCCDLGGDWWKAL